MTETDEVARGMLPAYLEWQIESGRLNTIESAREFVTMDKFLGEESQQVIDNVAQTLTALSNGRIR